MRLTHLLLFFTAIYTLGACSSPNRKFTIIGNVTDMPEQTVVLEQLNANDVITVVDSERSKPDGHFELSGISPQPGLYRIHFDQNKFLLVSIDKGNIMISSNWNSIENYTVTGSAASENLQSFIVSIRDHLRDFNTMSMVLDTLQARGNDSILTAAKKDFMDMRQKFTLFVERYADTTHYEPNAIFAARILNPQSEGNYLNAFSQSLGRKYPGARMTKDFMEYYGRIAAKQKQPAATPPLTPETGKMAPEITLTTPDGQSVTLSSLRGKYVLIDFWASWCGPCRAENPNVVAAYNKYKSKNFTIFGVSLDNNKEAWEKAIKADGLTWTQVSDLKGWSSAAAATYSIQSIPTNYLLDTSGKIIAKDLRGDQLEARLDEVLKTPAP